MAKTKQQKIEEAQQLVLNYRTPQGDSLAQAITKLWGSVHQAFLDLISTEDCVVKTHIKPEVKLILPKQDITIQVLAVYVDQSLLLQLAEGDKEWYAENPLVYLILNENVRLNLVNTFLGILVENGELSTVSNLQKAVIKSEKETTLLVVEKYIQSSGEVIKTWPSASKFADIVDLFGYSCITAINCFCFNPYFILSHRILEKQKMKQVVSELRQERNDKLTQLQEIQNRINSIESELKDLTYKYGEFDV